MSAESLPPPEPAPKAPATLHEARSALPKLIQAASRGQTTPLSRGDHQAFLMPPTAAAAAGWDLATAPAHPIAEARKKLGDLIQAAAEGRPQVLRRHSKPVAVLLPTPPAPTIPTPVRETPHTTPPTNRQTTSATAPDTETTPQPTSTSNAPAAPPRRRIAPLAQALTTLTTAARNTETAPALHGLSTGITALDQAIGGLQPGRFYLVAGAPGAGSSLIATTAARTTALTHHRPVLYAASGLTRTDIAARVIAAHTPTDYRRLRAGTLTHDERQAVTATTQLLTDAPLFIDDDTDLTAAAIASTVPDVPHLALLVVDRLQAAHDPRLPLSGPTAIADAVQTLAHLARTRQLPVLAAIDTDDPTLLQALATDLTLILTRDGTHTRLTVAERDIGPLTTVTLTADLAHARITDPATPPTATSATVPAAVPGAPATLSTDARQPAEAASTPDPITAPSAANTQAPEAPANTPEALPTAPQEPPDASAAPEDTTAPMAASQAVQTASSPSHPPAEPIPPAVPAADSARPAVPRGSGYAGRDYSYFTQMISDAVEHALEEHDGDTEAATEALIKQAIPNGMELFEATRVGGNYEHTVYPETLEFLRKKTKDGVDEIWEGRHNWENPQLTERLQDGVTVPVTALDTNASYLSAFKTYLPIGALRHDPEGGFDPKRSGIYRLPARPTWDHPHLPDPIGNRRETGPVLLDDATIRLLIRCAKQGLCEPPHIVESWTSGATEGLLEKFRRILTEARHTALQNDDTVTLEYIKAMYSKFVSTIGESSVNRDIRRPDWMHIIRSQAFANLWLKAHRAHKGGLTIVRVRGTDELHVTGDTDWRTVFNEGRHTTEMKIKDEYTLPRSRKSAR
ncbi:type II toxin-antitoxin system prevent-host-death family antitoxin [Streptomyces chattanoogensis]